MILLKQQDWHWSIFLVCAPLKAHQFWKQILKDKPITMVFLQKYNNFHHCCAEPIVDMDFLKILCKSYCLFDFV